MKKKESLLLVTNQYGTGMLYTGDFKGKNFKKWREVIVKDYL